MRSPRLDLHSLLAGATLVALSSTALGQNLPYGRQRSPGMPTYGITNQTDRFTSEFNPAIGAVIDSEMLFTDADNGDDGFDLGLRVFEIGVSARIDPFGWAYAVLVAEEEETAVEEAAAVWTGWDSNATLKAGRFFIDFGKQMQIHPHDLRTFERPVPLAAFLGDELGGDGIQFDNWFGLGEDIPVRYSFGVFNSLRAEEEHGEEEEDGPGFVEAERQDLDELGFSARITGMGETGPNSLLQVGASARLLPDYAIEGDNGSGMLLTRDGLKNTVYGVDVTWQWNHDVQPRSWIIGAEYLQFDGDSLEGEVNGGGTAIDVADDDYSGAYAFVDYAWDAFNSAGVQWEWAELPDGSGEERTDIEVYYTHMVTEFQRIRLGVTHTDFEDADDEVRLGVQYTIYLGPHAHGINW